MFENSLQNYGRKIISPGPVVVGPSAAPHVITVLQTASSVFCRRRVSKLSLTSTTRFHQGAVGKDKGKDTGLSRPRSSLRITGIFVGTLHGLHTQKLYQFRSRETSLPWESFKQNRNFNFLIFRMFNI